MCRQNSRRCSTTPALGTRMNRTTEFVPAAAARNFRSMKEYFELASRVAAVASTAAIICAGAYELGYLFLIGVHFMGAASITDFFVRALELFPMLAFAPAFMFLVYTFTDSY